MSLVYDVQRRSLAHEDGPSPVRLQDGRLRLHALIDRGLVEVFVDDGLLYLPLPRRPAAAGIASLEIVARGGQAKILKLDVHELASIWPAPGKIKP